MGLVQLSPIHGVATSDLSLIGYGPHSLWVSATNTRQQSVSAQRTLHVQLQDLIGPSLELSFNGARLEAGATLTTPGTLGIQAQDINGVFTLALSLDGETLDNLNPGGAPV